MPPRGTKRKLETKEVNVPTQEEVTETVVTKSTRVRSKITKEEPKKEEPPKEPRKEEPPKEEQKKEEQTKVVDSEVDVGSGNKKGAKTRKPRVNAKAKDEEVGEEAVDTKTNENEKDDKEDSAPPPQAKKTRVKGKKEQQEQKKLSQEEEDEEAKTTASAKDKDQGQKQSSAKEPQDLKSQDEEKEVVSAGNGEQEPEVTKKGKGRKPAPAKKGKKGVEEKEKENEAQSLEAPPSPQPPPEKDTKKTAAKAGTKRKAEVELEQDAEQQSRRGRSKGLEEENGDEATASKGNKTDWSTISFVDSACTKDGRAWNKKFSTWNVNGIRAWLKNGGFTYIQKESPDFFCLQETKCDTKELPMDELKVEGYVHYWLSGDTKGYSGTGVYSKEKPLDVTYGIDIKEHDAEGRVITLEYPKFFLVVAYVPNSGEKLKRLSYRQQWNVDFTAYLKKLDAKKPVILCGDLNVAHEEIDLANPKSNTKSAGFTKEEREDFTTLLKQGFVDSYRHLYPGKTGAYTYWSYRSNARAKNTGWRLDYFVVSERFMKDVCDCVIRSQVCGSDHCPLVLLASVE